MNYEKPNKASPENTINTLGNSEHERMKKHKSKFVNILTPKQRIVLESLTKNRCIVIVPSDKDISIVILDEEECDKACLDTLMHTNYYEELNENPNTSYQEKFTKKFDTYSTKNLSQKMNMIFY